MIAIFTENRDSVKLRLQVSKMVDRAIEALL